VEESDINTFPRLEGKKMNRGGRVEDLRIALKVAMPDMLKRLPGIQTIKMNQNIDFDIC